MVSMRPAELCRTGGNSYLGHGLIVDTDEIARRGVDLESLVEGQGGVEQRVG